MAKRAYRIRPLPMRVTGWAVFSVGILTVVLNLAMDVVNNDELLPGGHSPWYLVGGIFLAAAGLFWTGLLDAK